MPSSCAIDLRVRLGIVRELVGDRIDVLLRRKHALDLLLGQRDLLDRGSFRGRRRRGLGRRRLLRRRLLGLRQHVAAGNGRHRERETGDAQGSGGGAKDLTHGRLLSGFRLLFDWVGCDPQTGSNARESGGKSWRKKIGDRLFPSSCSLHDGSDHVDEHHRAAAVNVAERAGAMCAPPARAADDMQRTKPCAKQKRRLPGGKRRFV